MLAFVLRRLAQALFVIAAMLVIVFFGVNVVGDPIYMLISPEMDQQQIAETARALGLDRPIWEQFLVFLKNAVQGDLGRSFVHGESAIKLILSRMPATLELAFVALVLAVVIGLPLGLYAGLKPESRLSRFIMAVSILGFSLPTFWVGLMLILTFAVSLGWLPATGRGPTVSIFGLDTSLLSLKGWQHVALPAFNLALLKISLVIRLARAGAREAALMDYVKFARAKGLSQSRIIGVHILKNIMIPIVTVLGLEFGSLVAFSVVTETIFAWPGMGRLLLEAITRLDRPVIVAYVMVVVVLFVTINLLVDLIYSALDPRVRLTEATS
ncbi:Peptide/nickel transport system permease protein [Bosea sp. 62]|uniref:ABC transporter permease n=1 Tax=unclassified Bosea (in: a-proteobacteria) TaxID=2653178 RepID=UPI0012533652|nr:MULTISPECIES: ABC transporter permease [unclassified Bosea (in: a-proteobacteria)]CAD5290183.1 Peptide/nickel transport system permease protein [Bosea sp. 7B]CAD5300184.1 Peptide/nickel transport system permease protein [Bosea sp. 21B]CAD5300624.1 Peptide/nickel transport system permease protein [Bosea sp. 46]VVT61886.1 Peptide/nickel transport system permease protein [Bosea sp. EC-HK365B]VXB45310.1 Peptide/nickel transport system permease protein [Bosea sp. 125]